MKCSKKFTIVLILIAMLFNITTNIFAAINDTYDIQNQVKETDLEEKIDSSDMSNTIGKFIYATASLVEHLIGVAFKGVTGQDMFPWADRVVFNSVPMLDINFFNPSNGSMFRVNEESTVLSQIVRSIYFTILAIAIGFLGIVIAISAIKLALSGLANQKAKYKEAFSKWIFAVVMLFLMHNLISFIFFVNEKMVEVASGLLNKSLEKADINLFNEINTLDYEKAIDNFLIANDALFASKNNEKEKVLQNKEIAYSLMSNSNYQESVLKNARTNAGGIGFVNGILQAWNRNGSESLDALVKDIDFILTGSLTTYDAAIENTITIEDLKTYITNYSILTPEDIAKDEVFKAYYSHVGNLGIGSEQRKSKLYATAIINVYNNYKESEAERLDEKPDIISNIAQYLKTSAYTVPYDKNGNMTGWKRSRMTIQGALLYGIFVFQSLFFFISYVRRFFYVVALAMMAPAIVILDFLGKSLS